ncbi:MAG: DUF3467 domain-containing protein [Chloroflexi bacterium]|nr:DUF3467 domain-containing protein [Chloroflexota bacterium]
MPASPEGKAEGNGQVERVEVPIRWENPDDIPLAYAGQILVRHTKNDFMIRFYQVVDPPGTSDEQPDIIASQGYMSARCVASIAVSAGTMAEFMEVLQDNYQKYLSRYGDQEPESD